MDTAIELMKLLIIGNARQEFLNILKEDDITKINSPELAIPFPYTGKLYHNNKPIILSDYDAVILLNAGNISKYLYDLLSPQVCVIGNPYAYNTMADKVATSILLENNGIKTVESIYYASGGIENAILDWEDLIVEKPVRDSLGHGVKLLSKNKLEPLPKKIYQKYIECNHSDERWIIVGGKCVCAELRQSSSPDEFRSSLSLGGIGSKLEVTEEMQELSSKIYACLPNSVLIGADIFRDSSGNVYVGELNSRPGFKVIEITDHNFYIDIRNYIINKINKYNEFKNIH